MSILFVGEEPEITEWIRRRRELGQDGFDEVWEGVYHVPPIARSEHAQVAVQVIIALETRARAAGLRSAGPFNLGTGPHDFRVPDGGWFSESPNTLYVPTACRRLCMTGERAWLLPLAHVWRQQLHRERRSGKRRRLTEGHVPRRATLPRTSRAGQRDAAA